ncbi:hypothetical protein CRG98_039200 [Punica granatum]|uniref:Uncharacterized protein n=1 Tax=Punica granatum TaxID=22663 RepID=A0A2I0I9E6_PUNGR|nr:hypothetical protein CRG98_039200 [Punica granatum]
MASSRLISSFLAAEARHFRRTTSANAASTKHTTRTRLANPRSPIMSIYYYLAAQGAFIETRRPRSLPPGLANIHRSPPNTSAGEGSEADCEGRGWGSANRSDGGLYHANT